MAKRTAKPANSKALDQLDLFSDQVSNLAAAVAAASSAAETAERVQAIVQGNASLSEAVGAEGVESVGLAVYMKGVGFERVEIETAVAASTERSADIMRIVDAMATAVEDDGSDPDAVSYDLEEGPAGAERELGDFNFGADDMEQGDAWLDHGHQGDAPDDQKRKGDDVGASFLGRMAGRRPLMTHDETVAFAHRIQAGDLEARNEFVERNMRLVVNVARAAARRWGLEIHDLFQVGTEGLVTAVEKFDPSRGRRFSTMAMWWIRQAIQRHAQSDKLVRVPTHLLYKASNLERLAGKTTDEAKRERLLVEAKKVRQDLAVSTQSVMSIDTSANSDDDGEGRSMHDILEMETPGPEEIAAANERRELVAKCLNAIPARDARTREIMQMYFGLHPHHASPMNLKEIARQINISAERVSQLQTEGCQWLYYKLVEELAPRKPIYGADGKPTMLPTGKVATTLDREAGKRAIPKELLPHLVPKQKRAAA